MKKLLIIPVILGAQNLYAEDENPFNFGTCSGEGDFQQEIISYNNNNDNDIYVGKIPQGIKGLEIQLISDKDVDIRLYGENDDKIVRWPDGLLKSSTLQTKNYQNMGVTYSGYNGTNGQKGHEFINIEGNTTTELTMKAFGYETGYATVHYSWTDKEGCQSIETGHGTFQQDITEKDVTNVGEIPSGIDNLNVKLTSNKDIDIQLYGEDGAEIIKWPSGILNGPSKQTIDYNDMHIEWSGYNGTNGHKGNEYIKVTPTTTEKITMKVYGYQAGQAKVDYSWGELLTPDYKANIYVTPTLSMGSSIKDVNIEIDISEINNGSNTGDLEFEMSKNNALEFDFDKDLHTIDAGNGTVTLDNGNWEVIDNGKYIFKYVGNNGNFPNNTKSILGLKAKFTPPSASNGNFPIKVYIRSGNGEVNTLNNAEQKQFTYKNKVDTIAPDYTPTLSLEQTEFGPGTHVFDGKITISELNNRPNTGDIKIALVKNNNMSITLKNTDDWVLEDYNAFLYMITYKGNNGHFTPNSTSTIPLQIKFETPSAAKGHFLFTAKVRVGSGDTNDENDEDIQIIKYNDYSTAL